ncbi:hypothetical protein AB0E59_39090 [Lentzea sp. NPDC034063]|uniref:hypothetical protein n=1 Tax=unclassified Lentzea TaxID=2643253 RepID=UPI0033F9C3A5
MTTNSSGSSDYRGRLRQLGMDADQLKEALGASNQERGRCDLDHCSKSAPGYYAYNGMLSSMSRQMSADGWERHDPMSMPLMINHDTRTVAGVTSGDQYTGLIIPGERPTTRNPKGELTRALIKRNRDRNETALIEISEFSPTKELLDRISEYNFWLVLVYFDKDSSLIRCEVSKPITANSKGHPQSWEQRIILPPYDIGPIDLGDDDPNDGFDPIDIPLTRR